MENTFQASIPETDPARRELYIALLSAAGFEAFEETDMALIACAPASSAGAETVRAALGEAVSFSASTIAPQNWNARWEAGFEPVTVDGFCTIRAHFHPKGDTEHDIIITPKMSFGTGHHATTQLMVTMMRDLPFSGKKVLDFGSGTGVLAILAGQLGAADILGIDIDDWVTENAVENGLQNGAPSIRFLTGSLEAVAGQGFDRILANINRHILLQYMEDMAAALNPGGQLLLSGILTADEALVAASAKMAGLNLVSRVDRAGWACMLFALSH